MTKPVKMAFNPDGVKISLDKILPLKKVKSSVKKTMKYRQISTSISEVGVIEHLVVYPQNGSAGNYLLLDGHLRFEVLKEIGQKKVFCLVSTDDEAFTYNHKVNRISPIQKRDHPTNHKRQIDGINARSISRFLLVLLLLNIN